MLTWKLPLVRPPTRWTSPTSAGASRQAIVYSPGCTGVTFHSSVFVAPGPSGPTAHVSTYAESPPFGPWSSTQTGRAESLSAGSPLRVPNAVGDWPAVVGLVRTTTARFGIGWSPLLTTSSVSVVAPATCCLAGKEAPVTSSRKSPDGASASWRSPPPQPAAASTRAPKSAIGTARARRFPIPAATIPARNAAETPFWRYQGLGYPPRRPQVSVTVPVCGYRSASVVCRRGRAGKRRNAEGSELVRAVADRAFLPAKGLREEVGDMMILTGKTIVSAIRPPYPYGGEFVAQFMFALRLCWFPLLVSTVAFGYAAPGLQAANFLVLFGALDRLGGFFVLASIREFAPFVTAIVLAGVAGTAITADLGARKIREELDALQVLGVDPVKNLVVPRFLALMLVTGLFDIYAILFGVFGGIVTTLVYDQPLGPFRATFLTNASVVDLWGSVLKCTLFGAVIAIVCCYKGMTATGGAAGVGRAVNQAVVIAILGVFAFNYVFTQTLLATHPEILNIK